MSDTSQSSEGRGVQSIEVGTQLLEALIARGEPMMLKELAASLGIAPAQAHPYLVSFRNMGMVEKNESSGRYQLGPFALDLALSRMRSADPMQLVSKVAEALSQRTGLTTLVSVWGAFGPTVVVVNEGKDQLHMNTRVGTVYSVTGTATGRVFASYMPAEVSRQTIRSGLQRSLQDRYVGTAQSFGDTDMAEIRAHGVGSVPMPPVPGINAIAAPVFDHLGQVMAVLTMVGDARVLDSSPDTALAETLGDAAQQLSSELGYLPVA
ncbi:IclR family transcriptional regulator [Paracoccus sp. (in: a-proteobacteria)]|uniref:IclR family transcriptional regulator n=1 Tax=Paracoccus sp. TaxID=267 RepID=UPI003A8B45A1